MLRCIRCGACMNHCPVYHAVGGHAYGWVYPGPMGAVLTPSLIGVDKAGHLPNASTFCGRCESVCPVRIPLPKHDAALARARVRAAPVARDRCATASAFWALLRQAAGALPARDAPRDARAGARSAAARAASRSLPLAGGWTELPRLPGAAGRDLPGAVDGAAERSAAMSARDDILATHPPLARRHRRRERRAGAAVDDAAGSARRGASCRRAGSCRRRRGSRCSRPRRRRAMATRRRGRRPRRRAGARSPLSARSTTCPPRCAWATTRAWPPCRGARPRSRSRTGRSDGQRPQRRQPRLRRRRRDRHAGAGLGRRTTRRRSISCPTTTSWCVARKRHRRRLRDACGRRLRDAYGKGAHAAHGQLDHRPVALRPTSSRRCCSAPHGPRSLHIVLVKD